MAIGEKIDYKVFFTVLKFTYTREELLSFVGLKTSRKLVCIYKTKREGFVSLWFQVMKYPDDDSIVIRVQNCPKIEGDIKIMFKTESVSMGWKLERIIFVNSNCIF